MFSKLVETLSIRQQMYLVASLCVFALVSVIALGAGLQGFGVGTGVTLMALSMVTLCFTTLLMFVSHGLGFASEQRSVLVSKAFNSLAKGDLAVQHELKGRDEFAWLGLEFNRARVEFSKLVKSMLDSASSLPSAAEHLSDIVEHSKHGVNRQNVETETVANAINKMSATVQEVAGNAANAAQAAQEADQEAKKGQVVVKNTVDTINALANEVQKASNVIAKLKDESMNIGAVLDVIRGIAEQTNLLALNAAIEAARAGEQGRGFAVVADEVRSLASRTQQSTQEIQEMIQRLQAGANEAVVAMQQGQVKAEAGVEQAAKAGESLESITNMVDHIKQMNTQIAHVAEEQSTTAEEINHNVLNISQISLETSQGVQKTALASTELASLASQLQERARQFKLVG